jgi:hypothetical protein
MADRQLELRVPDMALGIIPPWFPQLTPVTVSLPTLFLSVARF